MKQQSTFSLFNRKLLSILFLGFSSGLPIALVTSTLQAWFTQSGLSLLAIGSLSFIGMPYVWKFLWAPLMDRYNLPLGKRHKGWICLAQLALCVLLFILALYQPDTHFRFMSCIALAVAFFSASQDVAIDAYRTDVLLPEERGLGSAYYIFAYRLAMLFSGGVALLIADYAGWAITYQIMAVVMGCMILVTYMAPDSATLPEVPGSLMETMSQAFKDLCQRDSIALIFLFVIFYKLGDALALALMTNFLLHGLGFTLTEVGIAYKTVALIATVSGALLGGLLLVRVSLFRCLVLFGLAQAFSNLAFMGLAIIGKHFGAMVGAIFLENFCSGMGTAAFMAFLMSLCNERYTATQYACLSALASIGRVCLGPVAGLMVTYWGWVHYFAWTFVLSFPGLFLLILLRSKVIFHVKTIEA